MKNLAVILGSFIFTAATQAEPDACWFLSMRKFMKPSSCDRQTNECSGMYHFYLEDGSHRISDSGTTPIPCQIAEDVARSSTRQMVDSLGGEAFDVAGLLDSGIIQTLQQVVILGDGLTQISNEVVKSMKAIDQVLIKSMSLAADVSDYHKLCSETKSSEQFRRFMNLLKLYARKTKHMPFSTMREDVGIIHQFVKLAFDILSVVRDNEENYVECLQDILSLSPPETPLAIFSTAKRSLELTQAIGNLAPTSEEPLNIHLIAYFFEDIEYNRVRDPGATLLTIAYIHSAVCPDIFSIIESIEWRPMIIRVASSLISLCSGVSRLSALASSNQVLNGNICRNIPEADLFKDSEYAAAASALLRGDSRWTDGFTSILSAPSVFFGNILSVLKPLVHEEKFNRFKTVSEFDSRNLFENTMLAFGRLCGVYMLNDFLLGPLLGLPFELYESIRYMDVLNEPEIFSLLRNNGIVRPTDPVDEAVMTYVAEPAFFVRLGMKDVLGPAGVEMFTPVQWSALFWRS